MAKQFPSDISRNDFQGLQLGGLEDYGILPRKIKRGKVFECETAGQDMLGAPIARWGFL